MDLMLMKIGTSVMDVTTVVVAGVVIVMAMLAALIVVFKVFGSVVSKGSSKSKSEKIAEKKENVKVSQVPLPPLSTKPVSQTSQGAIPPEVIAAITAAVVAYEGPNAVIRSVRRKNTAVSSGRKAWAMAGIYDNTRAF